MRTSRTSPWRVGAPHLGVAYLAVLVVFVGVSLAWSLTISEAAQFGLLALGLSAIVSLALLQTGLVKATGTSVFFGLLGGQLVLIVPTGYISAPAVAPALWLVAFAGWVLLLAKSVKYARHSEPTTPSHSTSASTWLSGALPGLAVFALFAITYRIRNGVPARWDDNFGYEIGRTDALFHEVLAQGLALNGWSESGIVADIPLRYHTLAYGWLGNVQSMTNSDPFVTQLRLAPLLFALILAWGSSFWALSIRGSRLDATLAPMLVLLATLVAIPSFTLIGSDVIRPFSLSSSFSGVMVLGLSWAMLVLFRERSSLSFPVALGGSFVASGLKTSSAPVIILVALGLVVASLITRRDRMRSIAVWAATASGATAAIVILTSGQEDSGLLELNRAFVTVVEGGPLDLREAVSALAVAALFVIPWIPRWSGLIGLADSPIRLEFVVGATVAAGALLALAALDPASVNRAWFPIAAIPIVSTLSGVGLGWTLTNTVDQTRRIRLLVLTIIAVGVFVVIVVRGDSPSNYVTPTTLGLLLAIAAGVFSQTPAIWTKSPARASLQVLQLSSIPLTLMALIASWMLPTLGSPDLGESQRKARETRWNELVGVTRTVKDKVTPDTVVVGDSDASFELAGMLGVRAAAAGQQFGYWGLGASELATTGQVRDRGAKDAIQRADLDPLLICTGSGPHLLMAPSSAAIINPKPSLTTRGYHLWWVDCR